MPSSLHSLEVQSSWDTHFLQRCAIVSQVSFRAAQSTAATHSTQVPPLHTGLLDQRHSRVRVGDPNLAAWWDVFDDPILTGLLQRAHSRNLTVKAAAFQILAAKEQQAIALGELLPQTQGFSLSFTRAPAHLQVTCSSGDVTVHLPDDGTAYHVITKDAHGSVTVGVPQDAASPDVISVTNGTGDISITK